MADRPRRVQRSRKRGWRMPPNTVAVSRGTRWGNPYRVRDYLDGPACGVMSTAQIMAKFDFENALSEGRLPYTREDVRRELRGKHLACWCPLDKPCHADVLLEVANGGDDG